MMFFREITEVNETRESRQERLAIEIMENFNRMIGEQETIKDREELDRVVFTISELDNMKKRNK